MVIFKSVIVNNVLKLKKEVQILKGLLGTEHEK